MAIKKEIEIVANTSKAEASLDGLKDSLEANNREAKKASESISEIGENGGAIAILDELTGGLATRLKDAFEASKLFNISLKGTRTALIATGIGAFVVALSAVVAYWDDIVDFITDANGRLERQKELLTSSASLLDAQLATINKQIESNTLQGKANEQLEKQRVAILQRLQEQNDAELKILENQLQRLKATSTEVGYWDSIVANVKFTLFGTKGLAQQSADLAAQRLKEIKELETAIEQAKLKGLDLEITLFNILNPQGGEREKDKTIDGGLTTVSAVLNEQIQIGEARILNEKYVQDAITQAERVGAEARKKIAEIENAQKLALTQDTVGKMSMLFGEASMAGKLAGSALALINTYLGVTQVLGNKTTLPEPFGTINKIASIALVLKSGFDAVKNINSVNVNTGGGGIRGVSSTSTTATPAFNLVQGTEGSQITNAINNQNNTIKAFVVTGDVSTGQELDRRAIQRSSI